MMFDFTAAINADHAESGPGDPDLSDDCFDEEPDGEPDTEYAELLDFAQDDGHYTYGMEDRGHEEALFGDC
jgi:hypothetical protein